MESNIIKTYMKDVNEALNSTAELETVDLFKKLYKLEETFSRKLKLVAGGRQVYKDFILFIRKSKSGTLSARQYFREREGSYVGTINAAIESNKPELMHKSRINFQFCQFAINNIKKKNEELEGYFEQIKTVRTDIISKYLPLALNKAKTYKRPGSKILEFNDLIQIANEGLISAVDKYVQEENGAPFHTVVAGRVTANLIASGTFNSAVFIGGHGNKQLYKVKKLLEKQPGLTTLEISDILGIGSKQVESLIAAASYFSLDQEADDTGLKLIDFIPSDSENSEDQQILIEKSDALNKLKGCFDYLTTIQKKVLILKGVKLENIK